MSQDHLVSVNVHDGFLPIFAPIFMEHYGSSSIFVRTLADCFTLRLARVLEKQGKLESPQLVARHSTNQAVERLEQWLSTVDGANRTAMQEALGLLPLGSMALLVEKEFGAERFKQWMEWLDESD